MPTRTDSDQRYAAPPLEPVVADTIPRIFFGAIDHHLTDRALLHRSGDAWVPIATASVERQVSQLAAAFMALGVTAGQRVALISENRPEWAVTDYALLGLGIIDVPIYATLPPNQVAYILNDCGASAILVSSRDQLEKIRSLRGEVPSLEHVICFDDPGEGDDVLSYQTLLARGQAELDAGRGTDFRERALAVGADDVATLVYTSGTTGDPKGVVLTHFNLASNVAAVHQHRVFDLQPGEVALSFLPLSHVFERMVDYFYWDSGATIAYCAVDAVADALIAVRPHVVAAAPRVFEKIYGRVMGGSGIKGAIVAWARKVGEAGVERRLRGDTAPSGFRAKLADRLVFSKLRERTGGQVRAFVSGSAPLSPEIARFFWAAGLPIYEGYGLTETSPVLTVNRPGGIRIGTVGQPIPGTEIRIGEAGEILARGPQIMKEYWNRPEETAQLIDDDGWLHTGDVGTVDAEGFLSITDRIKNLIVTAGGKNIAPQPIENEVAMSPYISQVVMIGDRRPFPSLLLVPDFHHLDRWARANGIDATDPVKLTADPRVREFIQREAFGRLRGLARYEMPKKVGLIPNEFTVDSGEMTPSLKIKRSVVEDHYRHVIDEIYAPAAE
jgi:long-chain acyl-CoA synthetase